MTVWVPRVQVHDAFAASGCCDGASKGEGHFDIRQSHGGTRLLPKRRVSRGFQRVSETLLVFSSFSPRKIERGNLGTTFLDKPNS